MKILFDGDIIAFKIASVSEGRSINVLHKASGRVKTYKSRTEFYGRKNNIAGALAKINEKRKNPLTLDDFEITDVQTAVSESEARRNLKTYLSNLLHKLKYNEFTDEYSGYVGKGLTFRHHAVKLQEYKGNRQNLIRPVHLDYLKNLLVKEYKFEVVTEIEADDALAFAQVQGYYNWKQSGDDADKVVIVTVDKDAKSNYGFTYNPNTDEQPKLVEGFGKLWEKSNKDVDGEGRIWLGYQMLAGDAVDNFSPSCYSDITFGKKAAYKALKDVKDDEQMWRVIVEQYKKMYPEPKTITNWKGETFTIDWLFVLKEIFMLCYMHSETYKPDVEQILKKYNLL